MKLKPGESVGWQDKDRIMKYICLGYIELGKFENMSESERNIMRVAGDQRERPLRGKRTSRPRWVKVRVYTDEPF